MKGAQFAACWLCIISIAMVPLPAGASGNVARGRAAAVQDCSACHQVTERQVPPAPVFDADSREQVAAPTFRAISNKYAGKERQLRAFVHLPRYPMREQDFLAPVFDDIVAYIRSLHRKGV